MGLAGDHNQEAYRSGLLASAIVALDMIAMVLAMRVLPTQVGFADAIDGDGGTTTTEASYLLTEGFGPASNGPLIVFTELPVGTNVQALQSVDNLFARVEWSNMGVGVGIYITNNTSYH
jgi:hypothetical protein